MQGAALLKQDSITGRSPRTRFSEAVSLKKDTRTLQDQMKEMTSRIADRERLA